MVSEIISYIALAIISAVGGLLIAELRRQKALRLGIQVLLRDRLTNIYFECLKRGYANTSTKNLYEALYKQYHALGKNGVMDYYYHEMMRMKDKPKNVKSR